VPRDPRNEDGGAFLEGTGLIVEEKCSPAIEDIESFIHLEVPVHGDAGASHDLLRAKGELAGSCCDTGLDEDVAVVAKMNQVLALAIGEQVARLG